MMAHTRSHSFTPIPVYPAPVHYEGPRFVPPLRIPITNSTLFAYQAMRGNNGSNKVQHGPLYDSLYFFQRGQVRPGFSDLKVNLPDLGGDADLPPETRLFWDPTEPSHQEPQVNGNLRHAARSQNLPNCNHYSGSQGFANYGYILLNGVWVDPDTQRETAKALTNPQQVLPPPQLSHISQGPRAAMTAEEETSFYEDYVANLVEDLEADPRYLRISPATFARWAVGASSGDHYETTPVPVDMAPRRRTISIGRPQIAPVDRQLQFDIDTGSMLSGVYDAGRTPSPIYSAQGLDMSQQPVDFSRMDPQASIDINRAAYGTPERRMRTQEWLDSSIASTPTVYNSDAACEEFGSPGKPQSGVELYNAIKEHFKNLSNELRASRDRNEQKDEIKREMDQMKWKLERENFLIKRHLEERLGPAFVHIPPAPEAPANPEIERQLQKPKYGQYERYLRERESFEKTALEREAQSSRKMDAAHEGMLRCFEKLGEINDSLFTQLAPEDRANFISSQELTIPEWR